MPGGAGAVNSTHASLPEGSDTASRSTYRHGDLRNALVAAGLELARTDGPAAVTLREATRRAGVAPNAAYRHFADQAALLGAVSDACLAEVAREMAAEVDGARARVTGGRGAAAAAELDAVGRAYVHFALREPGLFRAAFTLHTDTDTDTDTEPRRGAEGGYPGPYGLLGTALDRAVEAGAMTLERRAGAEAVAWSSVHGLAMLLLDGPLRRVPAEQRERLLQGVLDMAREGLFTH